MSAVWRCRVCEGVNSGGRMCATCGAVVPRGEPARAAVRTKLPSTTRRAATRPPRPVPPTPRRREMRELPAREDMVVDSFELFGGEGGGYEIRPMPGGCLVVGSPRPRRR